MLNIYVYCVTTVLRNTSHHHTPHITESEKYLSGNQEPADHFGSFVDTRNQDSLF